MTLEDAINHARMRAETLPCGKCAEEHRQLVDWLIELYNIKNSETSNFTPRELPVHQINIAVPKDRLYNDIRKMFPFLNLPEPHVRQYFYKNFFAQNINLFIAKPKSIPQLLDAGLVDFAFCGKDIMMNYFGCLGMDRLGKIEAICDTGLNKVNMIYAERPNLNIEELDRPLICASEFPHIAEHYLVDIKGLNAYILETGGSTEGYTHIGADCIVDVCETGKTIEANGLNIKTTLFSTSTQFYGRTGFIWPMCVFAIINECENAKKEAAVNC